MDTDASARESQRGSEQESGNEALDGLIIWKKEAILAAWRAFNKASDNPMRAALNAAVKAENVEELNTSEFYEEGYSAAIDDCVGLLRNWRIENDDPDIELGTVTKSILAMKRDG